MASAKQSANRKRFSAAFRACRTKLASGNTFGKCMRSHLGGKRKKAKKSRRSRRR